MRIYLALFAVILATGCDSRAESDAKEAVKVVLRDPASAQFSNVEEVDGDGIVCGEVNSKNAYGAYTGALSFVYDHGRLIMEDDAIGFSEILKNCHLSDAAMNAVSRYNRAAERTR